MDEESLEVLKSIRGEIVKLRNDLLMMRVALENIEKEVKKPKETPQDKIVSIDNIFGPDTRIEKL
jgi:hypothetical protein